MQDTDTHKHKSGYIVTRRWVALTALASSTRRIMTDAVDDSAEADSLRPCKTCFSLFGNADKLYLHLNSRIVFTPEDVSSIGNPVMYVTEADIQLTSEERRMVLHCTVLLSKTQDDVFVSSHFSL